ncbi:2-succinyl-6-hydroxy-2,4-cyclohexadiene-1-carboxylate synthase [Pasteurellaceae bacterium HPA106]|nr:2-succinyl-6-hydroxy-2,4-cyclohexadiene-1-carboxylate synthase [Spirabiliibacterium pneumoniae]
MAVFLHGLLGDKQDWQAVEKQLAIDTLSLDLPLHGENRDVSVESFFDVACWLDGELESYRKRPLILVGYSLGARIALYYSYAFLPKGRQPHLLILEGGNLGLNDPTARQLRWEHDTLWAEHFAHHPIDQTLSVWYQQEVFASLSPSARNALLEARAGNDPMAISQMLLATSLAKQPCFIDSVKNSPFSVHYVCGEQDQKFCQMAQEHALITHTIAHAGHNAHRENPKAYAAVLTALFKSLL